jgi:hypothetical protein
MPHMSHHLTERQLPVGIAVTGGAEFYIEWGEDSTEVVIAVECRDGNEHYVTLSREDWEAVVAHVALPRFEHR